MPEMDIKVVLSFDECINLINMMDFVYKSAKELSERHGLDCSPIMSSSMSIRKKVHNSIMVSPEFSFYVQDKEKNERELLNYAKSLLKGDE